MIYILIVSACLISFTSGTIFPSSPIILRHPVIPFFHQSGVYQYSTPIKYSQPFYVSSPWHPFASVPSPAKIESLDEETESATTTPTETLPSEEDDGSYKPDNSGDYAPDNSGDYIPDNSGSYSPETTEAPISEGSTDNVNHEQVETLQPLSSPGLYSFGFSIDNQMRSESADLLGNVKGRYSYTNSAGNHDLSYLAGSGTGFVPTGGSLAAPNGLLKVAV